MSTAVDTDQDGCSYTATQTPGESERADAQTYARQSRDETG